MRMSRSRAICHAIALISLMVIFAGCAQRKLNLKEDGMSGDNAPATLQTLNVSGDASQLSISADKPLTYTFYSVAAPPKAVIDLAQTEPGAVTTPIVVYKGVIKQIEVARHTIGGSVLSRIEISLARNAEISVTADPADKSKLQVAFAPRTAEEKKNAGEGKVGENRPKVEDLTESAPASAAVKPAAAKAAAGASESTTQQPALVAETKPLSLSSDPKPAKQVKTGAKEDPKPANGPRGKLLTGVNIVSDGVELDVTGGVETFNAFKLTKPFRLVIDLSGVKNGVGATTVTLNQFGIGRARLGGSPEKLRIVFDAQRDTLPPYQVVKSDKGLKILFKGVSPATPSKAASPTVAARPKAAVPAPAKNVEAAAQEPAKNEIKAAKAKVSSVEAIDFTSAGGYSRISIKVSGDCKADRPKKVAGGWALTVRNCQLPRKLQRSLDTGAFASPVKEITPYQVRDREGYDARILVKLRTEMPFNFKQEGGTILWEIKNPETAEGPAPLPEVAQAPPVAVPPAGQKPKASDLASDRQLMIAQYPDKGKVYTGRKVTLEFSDADVRKIFQLIAEVSNLNFLISDDVTGTISLKLVNVPWDQALDVILESKNLEKRQEGNILYIKPKGKFKTIEQEEAEANREREKRMELKTRIFDVNFASISDVASQFDKLKSERGAISQDPRTNRVIVTDIDDRLVKMAALLRELDIPEKQVMIEARIVEATSTFSRDLGVAWGVHYRDGSASILGINQFDTGFGGVTSPAPTSGLNVDSTGNTIPGGAMGVSFGKLTSNVQLDLRLSAAATAGLIKIISTPKVVTLNNKAAKISQGQSIPYQTTSAEGTQTQFVEAALTLEVTPHITADGSIGMKIKASNNAPGSPVAGSTAPAINKKEANTELQVMNGETTVIGGIYVDNESDTVTGVPFLMDIPLLGWLFKSNSKIKSKTELLIFITPRIVS